MDDTPSGSVFLKRFAGIILVVVCVIAAWYAMLYYQHRGKVKIAVKLIPAESTLTLDGREARPGNIYMKPGNHTLQASMPNFKTATKKFNTGDIDPAEVIYLLPVPGSQYAINWLNQHPSVQAEREAQGGAISETVQNKSTTQSPFISQLPVLYGDGLGGFVRMSTAAPVTPGAPPAVFVEAPTPALRQGVLEYMRTRGYDPADMDIVFRNQSNPLGTTHD